MTIEDPSSLSSFAIALLNKSGNTPLAVRFRALFALKSLASEGSNEAVDIIAEGLPLSRPVVDVQASGMKVNY
jgi:hypothetical protein